MSGEVEERAGASGEARPSDARGGERDGGEVEWIASDLLALQLLRPLLDGGGYLPWSSGAMRPGGLVTICNEIALGGRRRVVELGAGASTVLLARLLREQDTGATLDAIEHDARWAEWVGKRLAREGLDAVAQVTLAPLEPHPSAALPWYAAEPLTAALAGTPVDLLIVDGPPAYAPGTGLARYPALPALLPFLAQDAIVVLDDILRVGESEILQRWERETALRFERREAEAIALGRRIA
ncbi:class I SAM-dependent methyltransferase [Conexibacter sp. CPCC 206217]|uniref:class I SAM-dependent methyltransferase n=1 Tax=Conexibacter sp. CPCC 206217 TaxID=3064574 RepID=UPI00271D9F40|nr:class I SAM-dependent methyltransferase [Conexibacter sp. CPCC 206217]MDO8211723.1 class I SAM-dependent methyltransferase [Conexibacter sp. CPCC 206217]